MKNIHSITILSILIPISFLLPQDTKALLTCTSSTQGPSADCHKINEEIRKAKEQATEENRIKQENLVIEQNVQKQQQQELVKQEEMEKIRKENGFQAKIKELEDRVRNLESQKSPNVTPLSQSSGKPTVHPIKDGNQVSKPPVTQDKPQMDNTNLVSTTETITQTPQKKIGWFKKIVNWFNKK